VNGWITQGSGDGGFDFVGALDLDPFGPLKSSRQVILGQAKCEKLNRPTNGLHIARLAARLRRGWVGVYVTTSYFSIPVQREVLSDRYPILLVDGARLAALVRGHLQSSGANLADFLSRITLDYEKKIRFQDPEMVLDYS
jgi:restriction endonuclease Mrr